ncbi:MAG TPA: DUF2892 domain-containing protein [Candidatus Kapabacteria bacterium]|nr:DUF2892 domain-containing protein [Candidatus Kapabacteria bacterium]
MKKNMSAVDRTIRVIIAVVIGILYLMDALSGVIGVILGIVAIIFLITGIIGICPCYSVCHISTKKKETVA